MEELFTLGFALSNTFAAEAILIEPDDELNDHIPMISTIFTVASIDITVIGKEFIIPEVQKMKATSAYVESLSDEQLTTLSDVLNSKSLQLENDNPKILSKKLK